MNNRRKLIIAIGAGALTSPYASFAQRPAKIPRIGFLGPNTSASIAGRLAAFRAGLREQGYVEGKNLEIEFRWAEGNYDRLTALAAELVRANVDIIVTHTTAGSLAVRQATTAIPIVAVTVGDPVGIGLAASLARPGGNLTGLSIVGPQIVAKRLELIKEAIPRTRRATLLYNADNPASKAELLAIATTASALRIELKQSGLRSQHELEAAFATMSRRRADVVVTHDDPMVIINAAAISRLTTKHRLPVAGPVELAGAGALLGYGVNFPAMFHAASVFVGKILKGAKPGDLPIEQPTKFELLINQITAKALGIKIPQSILVRADKVIE